jgi:hypothetical protein
MARLKSLSENLATPKDFFEESGSNAFVFHSCMSIVYCVQRRLREGIREICGFFHGKGCDDQTSKVVNVQAKANFMLNVFFFNQCLYEFCTYYNDYFNELCLQLN